MGGENRSLAVCASQAPVVRPGAAVSMAAHEKHPVFRWFIAAPGRTIGVWLLEWVMFTQNSI